MGFERGLLRGEDCQSFPQSLTPPLPQPPIRLRGSPLCGHFMLVCKAMIKLEPAMFYFQFYAHSQGTTGSAQLLHTGTREIQRDAFTQDPVGVSMLLLIAPQCHGRLVIVKSGNVDKYGRKICINLKKYEIFL